MNSSRQPDKSVLDVGNVRDMVLPVDDRIAALLDDYWETLRHPNTTLGPDCKKPVPNSDDSVQPFLELLDDLNDARQMLLDDSRGGGMHLPVNRLLPSIPGQFGRYRIIRPLGQGGMGAVYLAYDEQLRRQVALKVPHLSTRDGPDAHKRFLREARVAATLNHPNICPIHDVGEIDGIPYFTMTFIDGRPLTQRIGFSSPRIGSGNEQSELPSDQTRKQPKPGVPLASRRPSERDDREAVDLARKVALALAFAHQHGVIHRDLKPGNILIDSRGEPIVVDFGLACRRETEDSSITQEGTILGSPAYMSPEQALGQHDAIGPASDIYSLGVILYELLTGHLPYRGRREAIFAQIISSEWLDLTAHQPDLNPVLRSLCSKALAKRAEERFKTMQEFADELQKYLDNPETIARSSSGNRLHQLWGAVALIVLAGIIISIIPSTGPKSTVEISDHEGSTVQTSKIAEHLSVRSTETPSANAATSWRGWPEGTPSPAMAPFDAERAIALQESWAKYLGVPVEYTNSIGMKFRLIPPGEFIMGKPPEYINELKKDIPLTWQSQPSGWLELISSHGPQHRVILTQPFYLAIHEVTQGEFSKIMERNPSWFSANGGGKSVVRDQVTEMFPVEMVTWLEAAEFCAELSRREGFLPFEYRAGEPAAKQPGTAYRLPTEAESEFACRAGTQTTYWFGDSEVNLHKVAWYRDNADSRTHTVGGLRANPFGLYDTHGNVFEWVQDWWSPTYYSEFAVEPAVDPSGPPSARSSRRAARNGAWDLWHMRCDSGTHTAQNPMVRENRFGFRIALAVDAVRQIEHKRAGNAWTPGTRDQSVPAAAIAPFNSEQARARQEAWAAYLGTTVESPNSIGMRMVVIPPGEFLMGSPPSQINLATAFIGNSPEKATTRAWFQNEYPPYHAVITKPYMMAATEVTIGQYRQFVNTTQYVTETETYGFGNSSAEVVNDTITKEQKKMTWQTPGYPVNEESPATQITWNDSIAFCNWLSEREGLSPAYQRNEDGSWIPVSQSEGYRLPTEAEWEFACRAGSTTHFSFGDNPAELEKYAWFDRNAGGQSHKVAQKLPNPFGLYDLHGNVFEWCQDWGQRDWYRSAFSIDSPGPPSGTHGVCRGGTWMQVDARCRCAFRFFPAHSVRDNDLGFRPVRRCEWSSLAVRPSVEELRDRVSKELDGRRLYELGKTLAETGDEPGAISAFQRLIRVDSEFVISRFELDIPQPHEGRAAANWILGVTWTRRNDNARAIAAFRRATEIDPHLTYAHTWLGTALRNDGDLTGAVAEYRKATESSPTSHVAWGSLSATLKMQGDTSAAVAAFRMGTERITNISTLMDFGHELRALKDYDGAVNAYQKASLLSPKSAEAHYRRGTVLLNFQHKVVEGVEAYRQAVELDPKSALYRLSLGTALARQGKFDEAIVENRKAIELDPKLPASWISLASIYREQNELSEANKEFQRLVDLKQLDAATWNRLGLALRDSNYLTEAIAAFRRSVEIDPKVSVVWGNLGYGLREQGDFPGAIAALSKRLEINGNSAWTWVRLGELLKSQGDERGAIHAFQKATDIDSKHAYFPYFLGVALHESGDPKGGLAAYQKSIELSQKNQDVQHLLERAAIELGQSGTVPSSERLVVATTPKRSLPSPNDTEWIGDDFATWHRTDPLEYVCEDGLEFIKLDDQSLLKSFIRGDSEKRKQFRITADCDLKQITGLRIELLEHETLSNRGPGGNIDGSSHIETISVEVGELGQRKELVTVPIIAACADYSARLHNIRNLVTGTTRDGYGIWNTIDFDTQLTTPHVAVLQLAEHQPHIAGTSLVLRIRGVLGRIRLSLTGDPHPVEINLDPDHSQREAAQWLVEHGAAIGITLKDGLEIPILKSVALPPEPFRIRSIAWCRGIPEFQTADVDRLAGCTSVRKLALVKPNDNSLQILAAFPLLESLLIREGTFSEAGIQPFESLQDLRSLTVIESSDIDRTKILKLLPNPTRLERISL